MLVVAHRSTINASNRLWLRLNDVGECVRIKAPYGEHKRGKRQLKVPLSYASSYTGLIGLCVVRICASERDIPQEVRRKAEEDVLDCLSGPHCGPIGEQSRQSVRAYGAKYVNARASSASGILLAS